jgi:hypothetical protein
MEGITTNDGVGANGKSVVQNEGDDLSLRLACLINSCWRNQMRVQVMLELSWICIWRSQHCQELKSSALFIDGNMQVSSIQL